MKLRASTAGLAVSMLLGANSIAQAAGPWRANEGNTRGWMLMSPEERIAHQAKIRSFANYDDCHAYQVAHHRLMQERAKRLGLTLPEHGRDACAHLRAPSDPRD
jgi:hypothetical protein